MRIGFDAKRAVSNFTGLGNYSRFVISNLMTYYPDNIYKLFIPKLPEGTDMDNSQSEDIYSLKNTHKPFWRTMGIVKDIKKEHIDLYHGLSNELPFRINHSGVKSIVTIHDLIFLKYPEFYSMVDRMIYNTKAKYACRVADKIIAVSECTKRDIVEHYHIDPSKIEVVYQGCFPVFKERATAMKKEEVKRKYDLPENYLLSLGSIEERKNILLIVKALKQVPDIHFVAIGKRKEYADKVIQYAVENGLSDRVHLISKVPLTDLPAILQMARIFIYPSLYEGFGIPIIEALNSGVPVIGATGSCLEESGGPDSVYIDPANENELVFQINRLLSDAEIGRHMVEKGFEYVKQFSDDKCTRSLMTVYEELLT
ncbi:glycosyltransferase involved in cell wall biosynthesis [Dysgonomonas sp. PFB1-18]|uniref:glycosyltransferase family 4 protein n=1 Tax=unclassified Dysgonomonas TaxID=2630389 RepID=UPI00247336D7|nr:MULTISPECIES: glycosyltransferase family 1 protein [unclassified Dysgonomonas]MDL2302858.1 glycosyltransferase family 4 protein [Dysgonomonas sp. OttesenSCG-928-D17]MDH6309620.1 glycosyltransferase involved in cell wall biosynthesis [Dysgonomonas sp. PF1-14]MDH6339052.1 glycosyltransferase involved in cell wall biosynthesis [Dysgonomonas sp. PF1-16]MDH6380662.1 glycosyltransferase involved in cell wall biosynthesis [Dysgonomonas sp. PFB1-18]MDH6398158.1 glycosyltransferase involved in cell 